ncbi:MAG: radical SAM protein [Candidatus Hydrogenedentes bacterium]|nr:radical SAM protein [Candidatus Hydrogenedentota bacterium]
MKVALVSPPSEKGKYEHVKLSIPKMGIGYLAAVLESKGIECDVIDAKFERLSMDDVRHRFAAGNFDVVGISAMTAGIHSAGEVARAAKEMLPKCTTAVGGAHAIALPRRTMEEFDQFDVLATGEGEITLPELVYALDGGGSLDDVRGIVYRRDGRLEFTADRDWIEQLDDIPFPAWHKYPRTASSYHVLATRGCPYKCVFCQTILGKRVRKRSPENVVDEIAWLADEFKATQFEFLDETFTADRRRAESILDMLIDRGLNRRLRWNAQTRVDRVDDALFAKLKKAGCRQIEFGVESGNQDVLDTIEKRITLEQVEKAVRLAKTAGLKVGCSFILGHPFETRETLQDTIDFLVKLNPDIASVGIMIPLPGTKVYDMAINGEGNYIFEPTDWRDFLRFGGRGLELTNLSRHDLEKYQVKAYVSYYLKNFRVLDFMAYAYSHRRSAFELARKLMSNSSQSASREVN